MNRPVGKWLLCQSRGELYAIDLGWVREIDYHPQVLSLPTAEPPLCGLLAWRGSQLPAISLDSLLSQPGEPSTQASVILEVDGNRFALLVEAIAETIAVSGENLFALDPWLTKTSGIVTRAARLGDRLIFILDLIEAGTVLEAGREMKAV